MTPTKAYLRAVGVAAQAFLRTVSKVVGGEVLRDAIAFFQAFDGMEAGFRERAERVLHLLDAPETAYVLVTSPRRESVEEADFFARRLGEDNLAVAALIVNRMHPSFGADDAVAARAAPAPVVHVPVLRTDVHDLAGLAEVAGHIFGGPESGPG
jgi:anion-transporting  ArsA/GET3 family ATPase